ncbi:MAG: hypothetical protein ACI9EF_001061 [Pseudohongiellaceae bacterium]|jgi:hypothetical protein
MAGASTGVWDSHPDADVSRVLQPGIAERIYQKTSVTSNRFGLREKEYAMPKLAGTVRVVLLGDSYIFGQGVKVEQRLGVILERYLKERAGVSGVAIEVLHLGNSSWNLVAECSFLRRQLSLMQADLVLHVSVANDLADTSGIRGIGSMATLVPRQPGHTNTVVKQQHSRWALDEKAIGHLSRGLDYESVSRFEEAGQFVGRLAAAVERLGGRYLHTFHWVGVNPAAAEFIASQLEDRQVSWLPPSSNANPAVRISKSAAHWNPHGHEQMALYFYGSILDRALLPQLQLSPWEEASQLFRGLANRGRRLVNGPSARAAQRGAREVPSELVMGDRSPATSSMVNGGIDAEGLVGSFASVTLATNNGTTLRITGACLDRPEMNGAELQIFVDEVSLGMVSLQAREGLDLSLPLPEAQAKRPWVSVRFLADDYVYSGKFLRECVSFVLHRVAVEG